MKVAIGFFGITRSLKYSIESINKNIFDVFKENNIEYDIFIHTYFLKSYDNKRANEKKLIKLIMKSINYYLPNTLKLRTKMIL